MRPSRARLWQPPTRPSQLMHNNDDHAGVVIAHFTRKSAYAQSAPGGGLPVRLAVGHVPLVGERDHAVVAAAAGHRPLRLTIHDCLTGFYQLAPDNRLRLAHLRLGDESNRRVRIYVGNGRGRLARVKHIEPADSCPLGNMLVSHEAAVVHDGADACRTFRPLWGPASRTPSVKPFR